MENIDRLINELSAEAEHGPQRIIQSGFATESRLKHVKSDLLTRGEKRKQARARREATAGAKWFDLPAKNLELEDKLTLDAIKLRGTLDPTRFYKKKSTDAISEHFQIGTVVEHPIEYYSSRATRKERKQTLIDELIADAELKTKVKNRYNRLKATKAIRMKKKALAERRKK